MAWSVLQSAGKIGTTNSTSTSQAFTNANLSSGTKIIAAVCTNKTVSNVKDGAGNTLTSLGSVVLQSAANGTLYLYAMDTPAGDVGTMPTITVTLGTSGFASLVIQEVSGLLAGNTTAMLDGTAATTATNSPGNGGTRSFPAYSSTAANEYLIGLWGDAGSSGTFTASGYTTDANSAQPTGFLTCAVAYKNSSGGSESGTWSESGGSSGIGAGDLLVAFKLAGGAAITSGPPLRTGPLPNFPALIVTSSGWQGAGHSR